MYVSYFELKKILSELEKEYSAIIKDKSHQSNKKFGTYALQTCRRVDKEVKDYIDHKYDK